MRDPWYLINYGSNTNELRNHDYLIFINEIMETLETVETHGKGFYSFIWELAKLFAYGLIIISYI
jgi:hypothetical protein